MKKPIIRVCCEFTASCHASCIGVAMFAFVKSKEVMAVLIVLVIINSLCVAKPFHAHAEKQIAAVVKNMPVKSTQNVDFSPYFRLHDHRYPDAMADAPHVTRSPIGDKGAKEDVNVDPLSLIYYIGCFAALLLFFLVVSCSECCCEKAPPLVPRRVVAGVLDDSSAPEVAAPPPHYDNFAPPAYNSLFNGGHEVKAKDPVFIVPVHDQRNNPQ